MCAYRSLMVHACDQNLVGGKLSCFLSLFVCFVYFLCVCDRNQVGRCMCVLSYTYCALAF
jgi:hypothetical protein